MPNPNSLFDPSLLAQSFPDAAVSGHLDGLDPHRKPYMELAERFRNNQAMLGIAAQAGVSVDTAASVANLMNTPSHGSSLDSLATSSPEARVFAETVKATHTTMGDMLRATGDVFTLPSLDSPEFATTNWQRLMEATKAYEGLGIPSQVVLSPINRPLEGEHGWKTFFSGLRQWQDNNNPDAVHRLQNQTDGDGLWSSNEVLSQWDSVIDTGPDAPQWQASVVPTDNKPAVTNVAYDSTNALGDVPTDLSSIVALLPPTPSIDPSQPPKLAGHPKAESLMTLIASQLYLNKDNSQPEQTPIDSNTWTWAEGIISSGANGLAVDWGPGFGQVFLNHSGVGTRVDFLGVRPGVRG
jgi:hypothetical protein